MNAEDVAVLLEERALADDLANVLAKTVVGWDPTTGHDLSEAPEIQQVLARYREARAR